jgi:hypothetical protein
MDGAAILYSNMTPPPALEEEFNRWYDEEHIPLRMGVPGFRSAQRYKERGTSNYLVVYELDSPGVLDTAAYRAVKNHPSERTRQMLAAVSGFTRYLGESIFERRREDAGALVDAPVMFSVWFNPPPERVEEFDAWYNQEHIPLLLEHRDWLGSRRFRITGGEPDPWSRLVLHYLADARALESDVFQRARTTPWRGRLSQEPWFTPRYGMFERLGPRQQGIG